MVKIAATLLLLMLPGCTTASTSWDTIGRVKLGMTEAELLAVMGGPPYLTRTKDGNQIWVWTNPLTLTGASIVSFGLRDGRVVEVPNLTPFR